jgi:23S rRNA pseudouridine1911/1915/1917 synthase
MRLTYEVLPADDGQRAVDVLTQRTGMSRLMAKKIRLYGRLLRNGEPHRMIDTVHSGDLLEASYQQDVLTSFSDVPKLNVVLDAPICYEDAWLIVINKPANLVTHPSYLHEARSLTSLLADQPLHPVTRLDRDTSGVVLIALNGHAHHVLSSHPMRKVYLAALHGRLPAPAGLIQAPIRRSQNSLMLRETHPDGAAAKTLWRELHYFEHSDVSLVRFELMTGRTHQIRVHCQAVGCPLIGDGLYGHSARRQAPDQIAEHSPGKLDEVIGRQALHAASILFRHPISGDPIVVTAALPVEFRRLLQALCQAEHPPV